MSLRNKILHSFASVSWVLLVASQLGNTHASSPECTFTGTSGFCTGMVGKFLRPDNNHNFHVIRAFYIVNSDLTSLTAEDFSQFQSLITLHINNCTISRETTDNLLSGLKALTALQITYSKLSDDVISMFVNNIALNSLTLQWNLLTRISKDAFSHLKDIKSIDISNNKISDIEEGAFLLKNMPSLQKINLAYNTLGEHFDPSVGPETCAACGDACSSSCRANAVADHLWQQLEDHYDIMYLDGNPLCSKIENMTIDDVITESNDTATQTDRRQTFLFRACNQDAINGRKRNRKHNEDDEDTEAVVGDVSDTSHESGAEVDGAETPPSVEVNSDLPPTSATSPSSVRSRPSAPAFAGGRAGRHVIPSPSSADVAGPQPLEGPMTSNVGYVVGGVVGVGVLVLTLAAVLFFVYRRYKQDRNTTDNQGNPGSPSECQPLNANRKGDATDTTELRDVKCL